jgi:hypothetical protein
MKKAIKKLVFVLPAALLMGCEPEFDDIEFNGGVADFSTTVAVGNSLTAGYQSNALRRNKQEVSFPALVAQQLKQVGGGEFKQPLMDPGVGLGASLNAEFGLSFSTSCTGETSLAPSPIAPLGQVDQINPANFVGANGPFNNVGVPGAKSYHLVAPGFGDPAGIPTQASNPFYARFVNPSDPNETVLAHAMRNNPTFFMLWIGNNDVLGYATSGGSGVDQTGNPNPATYGGNDITDPTTFAGIYQSLVTTLTANGAKGVVANIPDVTAIPYFNTVPIGTDAITEAQAQQLNAAYAAYNGGLDMAAAADSTLQEEVDRRKISFTAGQINTFVVKDPSLTPIPGLPRIRQIAPGEYLTLVTDQDSLQCSQLGTQFPIQPQFHLTSAEVTAVKTATDAYNTAIRNTANANGLAFVDMAAVLNRLAQGGVTIDGITFDADFVSGGAFSLDGVHLSTRGYAVAANEFINAINSTYGANVPKVSVGDYQNIEVTN